MISGLVMENLDCTSNVFQKAARECLLWYVSIGYTVYSITTKQCVRNL